MSTTRLLKKGSSDPLVLDIQTKLLALGFALPRFGADGGLGDETLAAYGAFLVARGLRAAGDELPGAITPSGMAAIDAAVQAQTPPPGNYFDERANHPHAGRSTAQPFRSWAKTTAVVLHQTATKLGESPARWRPVPIHLGITRAGKIIQLYDFTEVCNHANGLNGRGVGIEIDGYFAGVEGRLETLWQPDRKNPVRKPMDLPAAQRDAARAAAAWIVQVVAANGGRITHIHAHRQSSAERQSDPGSLIWKEVGLWAQSSLGLSDGGAGFVVGSGLKIPKEWDPRHAANRY